MLKIKDRNHWRGRIELDLVNFCNQSCRDCSRCCDKFPAPLTDVLPLKAVSDFVYDSIANNKVWTRIGLLGGEPTLHPQLDEVCEILKIYHDWSPKTDIWMMTNGKLKHPMPAFINVHTDRNKGKHHAFYVSGHDEGISDDEEFVCQAERCGLGLGTLGYMPCAVGTAMGRVWGFKGLAKWADCEDRNLLALTPALCRHCGWRFVHSETKAFNSARWPNGYMSPSWKRREEEWKLKT